MFQAIVNGHLGADAELKAQDGRPFVTFRIADTRRYSKGGEQVEETTWFSCILQGDGGELRKYLVKGQQVIVIGDASTRIYSSPKLRRMMASVDIRVRSIELVGRPQSTMPRQLADAQGMLHEVHTANFIVLEEAQQICAGKQSTLLYDAAGRAYTLVKEGWLQPLQTEQSTTEDVQQAEQVEQAENQDEIFGDPTPEQKAVESSLKTNGRKKKSTT